jgi:hypothetical protein
LPLPFQDRPGHRSKPGRPTDQVLDSHRRVHAALPWLGGNQTVDHRPRVPWHRQGVTTAFLDFGPHPFPEPALSHKTARSHVRRSPVQCGTLWRHWLQSLRAPHRTQRTCVAQEVRPARCGRQGALPQTGQRRLKGSIRQSRHRQHDQKAGLAGRQICRGGTLLFQP